MSTTTGRGKPLFLVGTYTKGKLLVTNLWTNEIVTAIDDDGIEELGHDRIIMATTQALTESGYNITRVCDHSKNVSSPDDSSPIFWAMHGPAVYTDFKIDYDAELRTAALIRNSRNGKEIIQAWSNVDGSYRLGEFFEYSTDEVKKFGHTTLRSFLDSDANMQIVTYKSPSSVCKMAIVMSSIVHVPLAVLVCGLTVVVTDEIASLMSMHVSPPYYVGLIMAASYCSLKYINRAADHVQYVTETAMALMSRHFPRNRES